MLQFNGAYFNKGEIYNDWHAGICFKSQKYTVMFFNEKGEVFKKSRWIYLDKSIDLEDYIKTLFREVKDHKKEELIKREFWIGNYMEYNKVVEIKYAFKESEFKEEFTILSPEKISNVDLNDFEFIAI